MDSELIDFVSANYVKASGVMTSLKVLSREFRKGWSRRSHDIWPVWRIAAVLENNGYTIFKSDDGQVPRYIGGIRRAGPKNPRCSDVQ